MLSVGLVLPTLKLRLYLHNIVVLSSAKTHFKIAVKADAKLTYSPFATKHIQTPFFHWGEAIQQNQYSSDT